MSARMLSPPPTAHRRLRNKYVFLEKVWVDSRIDDENHQLLEPCGAMIWLHNRDVNDAFDDEGHAAAAADGDSAAPPPTSSDSFVLVKALDDVKMRLDDQELLFLTRVSEDFSRNSMVGRLAGRNRRDGGRERAGESACAWSCARARLAERRPARDSSVFCQSSYPLPLPALLFFVALSRHSS